MPRTRRTPAPDIGATDVPQTDATPPQTDEAATPTRRRTRKPKAAEPKAAEPKAAEPKAAEPKAAEPKAAEPKAAEGEPTAAAPETPVETTKRTRGRRTQANAEPPAEKPLVEAPAVPAPTRRRGQPRKAKEAAAVPETPPNVPEPTEIIAQVAEGTPTEETAPAPDTTPTPARRRGRRRGSAETMPAEAPAAETVEAPDADAPVTDTDSVPADEEDPEKRGRRSRRGRRRRGGIEEIPAAALKLSEEDLLLPDEPQADEEEDEDDTLLDFTPLAAPVYFAPPLVPPALPPVAEFLSPRLTASVQHPPTGLPRIVLNGQSHAPYFFFVNTETARDGETVDAQIREAAANGIHLFSGVMYLPLRNAYGDRSFGAIDALVQQILHADPDGFLMPRLQFVPTNYWARTHPDQMARYADGSEGDVSVASTEFWADCVDALESLLAHFADPATPGGDRVIGFHLDRGEWFYDAAAGYDLSEPNQTAFQNWLHAKYQQPYALRAAWYDGGLTWETAAIPAWPGQNAAGKKGEMPLYASPREGRWPDYALFASEIVADIILGLADTVKTLSGGSLLVAVSYGYTLEFATRNDSGHLALGKLLQSPSVDIVAGPNSYTGRSAGSPAAFGAPIDSVALHGKLWLVEDDTKTFLAEEETDDTYNPKITGGADTQAIHQRHFGAALAHGAGVTWMDLWGQGWLNHPEIWREMGRLRDQADRLAQIASPQAAAPDVVVLVDEASLAFIKNNAAGLGASLIGRTRDLLLRSGASVGFYLQSDVALADFPEAKLYLFLNALRVTTVERQAIREKLQRPGKTLAWLYAPSLFDENGAASEEAGEVVGMGLRLQPWNARIGSQTTDTRHPITERMRGSKRIGQEEILNPSYAVTDPQAIVLAEYVGNGAPSLGVREHKSGWRSVFFGDPYLTNELLRGLYSYAGVPIYDAQDDVVYADANGVLLVHGPYAGQRTLTLPRRATVYDALEDKIIASDTRSFRVFLRARTTSLFLWGSAEAVTAATGLELPGPAQTAALPTEAEPEFAAAPASPRLVPEIIQEMDARAAESASPETLETLALGDDAEDGEIADSAESDSDALSAPRSRWQRRRAAARARRDAEREARAGEGTPEHGNAANPPVDIAELLPGLPPRRLPSEQPPAPEP